MSNWMLFLCMVLGGVAVASQPSINARLAEKVGLIESAFISFLIGALVLLVLLVLSGRGFIRGWGQASWWEYSGGLLGALFVSLTILVVPRLGTTAALAAAIAGQLSTGLLLDHFGAFGLRGAPIGGLRILGVVLLFSGAALVLRR